MYHDLECSYLEIRETKTPFPYSYVGTGLQTLGFKNPKT